MPRGKKSTPSPVESSEKDKKSRKPAGKAAPKTTRTAPAPDTDQAENIEAEIRERAYQLYEESGHQEGLAEEHWRRATEEVMARRGRNSQ